MDMMSINSNQLVGTELPAIKKMLESSGKLTLAHDIETAIETINEQFENADTALGDIMSALQANPQCSQQELFECCANAFQIAEKARKRARSI
jgi:hypothetical protein